MNEARLLNGKNLAATICNNLQNKITHNKTNGIRPPALAVILVGNDEASIIYTRNKREACEKIGINSHSFTLANNISEKELLKLINKLNNDEKIDGILLQLPLPNHIDTNKILEYIKPTKDVDGFHPFNLGRLAQRQPTFRPCTSQGVMKLLEQTNETFKHRTAVVVGASNIVGRPMALELLTAGSTVTICHRFTKNLSHWVMQADILVSAVGKPNLIKGQWIKEGSTVIDIGITRLANGKLTGDIEFSLAKKRAAWITPVPGGVGPMTVAMLLANTYKAATIMRGVLHNV